MIKTAGKYKARATEVMLGTSRNKGTPFVGVRFIVTDGPNKGDAVRWEGYFTTDTAERTLESLQHCGWTGDDPSVFANGLNGLDKNEVELVVEMQPYQGTDPEKAGNEYPKVRWVNRVGSGGGKFIGEAMDVVQAAAFGKQFRGLAMALKAKNGAAPAAKPAPMPSLDGDDIPF
jgi:hypothetical protein